MSKPKTGLESLGGQIAYRSKTLLLHNFKWREIIHCKTDRGGGYASSGSIAFWTNADSAHRTVLAHAPVLAGRVEPLSMRRSSRQRTRIRRRLFGSSSNANAVSTSG